MVHSCFIILQVWFGIGVERHFQQYFSYIVACIILYICPGVILWSVSQWQIYFRGNAEKKGIGAIFLFFFYYFFFVYQQCYFGKTHFNFVTCSWQKKLTYSLNLKWQDYFTNVKKKIENCGINFSTKILHPLFLILVCVTQRRDTCINVNVKNQNQTLQKYY